MKTKDIAKKYGVDNAAFDNWLKRSGNNFKSAVIGGLDVDESQNIDEIVNSFKQHQAELASRSQKAESDRLQRESLKQQALANMLVTSGFNFDGYTITKYSGYISGDDAVQVDRSTSSFWSSKVVNVADALMESLVQIRRAALTELKEAAFALGCNAVIGVDFDYLTLDPQTATPQGGTLYLPYVFGVTANGNAVVIERSQQTALQ